MIKILSTTTSPFVSTYKVSDIYNYTASLSLSLSLMPTIIVLHVFIIVSVKIMLPIYGVIALSTLSPLNPSLVPYSPSLLSLFPPPLSSQGSITLVME